MPFLGENTCFLIKNLKMAFDQLFHLILHEIDRFGCFMLKSGFFSKSLVLCLTSFNNKSKSCA